MVVGSFFCRGRQLWDRHLCRESVSISQNIGWHNEKVATLLLADFENSFAVTVLKEKNLTSTQIYDIL